MQLFAPPRPRQEWVQDPQAECGLRFVSSLSLATGHHHRAATPQDLVLDLIYVVFLARLGQYFRTGLHDDFSSGSVAIRDFTALFTPLWLQWWATCQYLNRWETEDFVSVIYFSGNMVLMATLGISSLQCGYKEKDSCGRFAFSFAGARGWLVLFQGLAAWYNPKYRKAVALQAIPDLCIVCIWIIVGCLHISDCRTHVTVCWIPFITFWWLGVVLDFLKHFLSRPKHWGTIQEFLPLDASLVTERQALFIVISIGELVTASLSYELDEEMDDDRGENQQHRSLEAHEDSSDGDDYDEHFYERLYVNAFFVVLIAIFIKLRYFDVVKSTSPANSCKQMEREGGRHAISISHTRGTLWIVMHIPLNASIVLLGAVLEILTAHNTLTIGAQVASAWSVATLIACCTIMDILHHSSISDCTRCRISVWHLHGINVILLVILPLTHDFQDSSVLFLVLLNIALLCDVCVALYVAQQSTASVTNECEKHLAVNPENKISTTLSAKESDQQLSMNPDYSRIQQTSHMDADSENAPSGLQRNRLIPQPSARKTTTLAAPLLLDCNEGQ